MGFRGIYPAVFTPFDSTGAVSESMLRTIIGVFIQCGVDGLYLCGGTGEGLLLTTDERKRVTEIAVDEARGRVTVMVHVGSVASRQAAELARHAKQAGADAVASVPPFYYGVSIDGVMRHYSEIAGACDLPLILYNIPSAVGMTVTPAIMEKLMEIPTVLGIKFSSYDLFSLWQMLRLDGGRLSVFSGNDEVLLSALAAGAHGSIGLTLNLLPRLYVELYKLAMQGNFEGAKPLQDFANQFVRVLVRYPVIPAAKEAMRFIGFDCGQCRGPLETLTDAQSARLREDLKQIGFFERDLGL